MFDDDLSLSFRLDLKSPYSFRCRRCGVCCNNKRIEPDQEERAELAAFLGMSPERFAAEYLDPATGELIVDRNSDCVFLVSEGCRVHPARPLVCRLFPLGLIRNDAGGLAFGLMPRHPDCLGFLGAGGTVRDDLERQDALRLIAPLPDGTERSGGKDRS